MIRKTSKAFKKAVMTLFLHSLTSHLLSNSMCEKPRRKYKVKWKQVKKLNVNIWEYYEEAMTSRNV